MQEHFLKNIEIIDFKCFKNFKAKGFKRVNLISGKNNVGKTAFLEACHINISSVSIQNLLHVIINVKARRESLNILNDLWSSSTNKAKLIPKLLDSTKVYHTLSNNNKVKYELQVSDLKKEYFIKINDSINEKIDSKNLFFNEVSKNNINFIDNFGMDNKEIIDNYSFIQKNDKEKYLDNSINIFDINIDNFKIIDSIPHCKTNNQYYNISEFGDGLVHLISIITSLYASSNGQLFIDEIDNGIHYTQLEFIWEIIFTISKEVNCQVFATSHSKEMINAYAKVAKKLEDEDISFIELGRNNNNEIKATVYDSEMFLNEIKQNHEVRGW